MGKGKLLTEFEQGQIAALKGEGLSNRQIAKRIARSPTVVDNYVKDPENYGRNRSNGGTPKVTERTKRLICRELSNTSHSCAQVKRSLGLDISRQTVWKVVKDERNLQYMKMKKKPPLTEANRIKRLKWCREKVGWNKEWSKIVFSDEKKFNLDGPDGFRYYWHDLRKEERIFSKHHTGVGTVMIWAAFSAKGKTDVAFIRPCSTALNYLTVLEDHLVPSWRRLGGKGASFMQDDASIHTANVVKAFFEGKRIPVLGWSPYSPDLNPIENLWGLMARKVYANSQQYNSVEELKYGIIKAWEDIDMGYIASLVQSMPKRVGDVIYAHGRHINY